MLKHQAGGGRQGCGRREQAGVGNVRYQRSCGGEAVETVKEVDNPLENPGADQENGVIMRGQVSRECTAGGKPATIARDGQE